MKRIIFFFVFSLLFFLCSRPFAHSVSAQDSGWVIDSFDSSITLQSSGEVLINEKIAVDFRTYEKHGIYRDLPYVYQNEDGSKYYTEIDVKSVLQDGGKGKYDVSRNDNNMRIKIGDANKTISGKHTYEIVYVAKGVLKRFSDHDELYWNVTGNDWDIHILKASATVVSEKSGIEKIACYQGYSGSTMPCNGTIESPSKATFSPNGFLGSNEGMTVVVGYKIGLYPILTIARPKTFIERMVEPQSLATLGISLVLAVSISFFLWLKNGRDYSFVRKSVLDQPQGERLKGIGEHETIVVEYEPPEKLRPAEIGVLTDERADTLDVVATIIDLAGRGYLSITEIEKSWVFGSTDYLLKKRKSDTSELVSYEALLFDRLFEGKDEVKVSSLKQKFYTDLSAVKKSLYERVVEDKLFPKNPESARGVYVGVGIVLAIIGFIAAMNAIGAELVSLADMSIGVAALGVFLLAISPFMSRKTAYGREMYRRVRGYQLFIATAEKYRQRFFEKKNLFNQVLPYAIVFGLTEKFASAMKDIGLPEKYMWTGWYYGSHPFNYTSFHSSMNSFATSMSSAIASAPKSSGFSSGGSSGGGFGGGGGGSW